MRNIVPRVQVSIVPKKGCIICMDSKTALSVAASLIQQVRRGDPNIDRYEGKTYCYVPEHDVPTGSYFTISVLDNLDEMYESEKDESNNRD
jgi:hypothetical protein